MNRFVGFLFLKNVAEPTKEARAVFPGEVC